MKTLIKSIKYFAKILAIVLAITPLVLPVQAADKVISVSYSAVTPTNLLSGGKYLVKDVLLISSATNTSTIKFYDSTGATNYVRAATTAYASYATNYNVVFTNAGGILITNTYAGVYRGSTSVAAATNELPSVVGPYLVTAAGSRTLTDLNIMPVKGLTLYGTGSGIVEITYEQVEP